MCRLEFVSVRNEIEFLSALNVTSCEVFYSNSQNHVPYATKSPSTYQLSTLPKNELLCKLLWGLR